MTVVTAERSLGAVFTLVIGDETTLERLPTAIVAALHLYKGTPFKLLFEHPDVQVLIKHFQLALPLTPDLTVRAVDLKLFEGHIVGTVVRQDKSLLIAEGTTLSILLNALDALFAEVMAAAACEVGIAKHQ